MAAKSFKVSELMAGYTPNPDFDGWVTNDDWVFAIGVTGEETSEKDYEVVQRGIAGLDAQLNPITQDKTYIRAGQTTTKTGTQRTFAVTGDRYIGDGAQDFIFSHKIKYGTGSDVVVPYIYFSLRTGKGEKGTCTLIVTSDVGGSAGSPATFACDVKGIGTPDEFDYTAAAG